LCTAASSVCQRLGAKNSEATRVDLRLIVRLARLPIWLIGLALLLLAASQPGFTILDPLTAGLLGLFLFGEHIQTAPA
jgi:hypothetical protein